MPAGLLVVLIVLFAALSALFSGIETAFFSLKSFEIQRLHERHPKLALGLERLLKNPRQLLSAILLADACTNLPLIILCLLLIREGISRVVPFWLAAVVIFTLVVIVCDLVPKILALNQTLRMAQIGVAVMTRLTPLLEPLSRSLQQRSMQLATALTPATWRPQLHLSEDEIETLVQLSTEEGALEAAESEMIQEIIKLGDKTVKDCMTPRVDVFAVPDDLSNEEVLAALKINRHRRVPVFADTPDDILGIIDVKAFLFDPSEHYTETMIPPSFVPETMKALDLLRSFLRHPQGMAVIVDEFGGTEGFITLNDLVEEIISDAVPAADQALYLEPAGPGSVIASGRTRLDDLAESGFSFTADGVDTIGGLIFNRLGTLPKAGALLRIDDCLLTVRRSSRKGVEEVLIAREAAPKELA